MLSYRVLVNCSDLADARDFVTGNECLDAVAAAAGLAVVGGASSVPTLSNRMCQCWQQQPFASFNRIQYHWMMLALASAC